MLTRADANLVDELRDRGYRMPGAEGQRTGDGNDVWLARPRTPREEFVVQRNGEVRQAGATAAEAATVREFRTRAERDLFTFVFGVLDQWWLYPPLHRAICAWLQRVPPHRKALVTPRGHGKSTLVCQGLPLHMVVQTAEDNIYFPGLPGTDVRILMCGEKIDRAQDHLRVIESELMTNQLLRALWPHIAWDNPKRQSKKWNDTEMIVPRKREWPDPTIRAIGVGGAITGAHPPCLIKDDITTEAAANSPIVMQAAIRWHENVRALLASQGATPLEFIAGTRWAVGDLIDHIETEDPTVEVNTDWRQLTDGGRVIYPQNSRDELTDFGKPGAVEALMKQHGVMFWLLYMNTVSDSALVDFSAADLREFELRGSQVVLNEDDRDSALAKAMRSALTGEVEPLNGGRGMTLSDYLDACDRLRAGSQIGGSRLAYIRGARGSRGEDHARALKPVREREEPIR